MRLFLWFSNTVLRMWNLLKHDPKGKITYASMAPCGLVKSRKKDKKEGWSRQNYSLEQEFIFWLLEKRTQKVFWSWSHGLWWVFKYVWFVECIGDLLWRNLREAKVNTNLILIRNWTLTKYYFFSTIAEKCKNNTLKYIDAGLSQHQAHVQVCHSFHDFFTIFLSKKSSN